ncbi:hypothetical protein, variant 2 [Aphanomyces astaci]|uniref:WW domain-containing protein n=2 Tax=Aphanomyces astaci TaxID=112090 RepID=W4FNK2_APHAT|nr:hypothetical protein, variant 2 [Aphanomyces astaci]ETV69040.1 hypothetical protein, variant 2 [Aphanomyces astaci]|eukprot:XP_009841500.1 hypothetical protein, variant 2 [Aphanomyces astaci]
MSSDDEDNVGTPANILADEATDSYEVLYEGMVKRKSGGGGGRSLKSCQLRIYADGVLVDIGMEREYTLLDVTDWQIDRKKIKDAALADAGLRVDCRGNEDRVVTLWLVLPSEQERHKWKVYLLAGLHPNSKEGQRVRRMVAQQNQQDKIRIAEVERTRQALAHAQKPPKKKPIATKSTRVLTSESSSDWQKYTSDDGQVYYYNATTQESRWTLEPPTTTRRPSRRASTLETTSRSRSRKPPVKSTKKSLDNAPSPILSDDELSEGGSEEASAGVARLEESPPELVILDTPTEEEQNAATTKKDVTSALEMMLGRGPPSSKLTKLESVSNEDTSKSPVHDEPPDDLTLTTAERLRLKRQQRQTQMFTTDDVDDTDIFLQKLAEKAKKKANDPLNLDQKLETGDPFQFPMDEWLDVEQEILLAPPPGEGAAEVPNPENKSKKKKKKKLLSPPLPPPLVDHDVVAPLERRKSKKSRRVLELSSQEDQVMSGAAPPSVVVLPVKPTSSQMEVLSIKSSKQRNDRKAKKKKNAVHERNLLSQSSDENSALLPDQPMATQSSSAPSLNGLNSSSPLVDHVRPTPVRPTTPLWTTHIAPDGREYYFNTHTQTSVWDKPIEFVPDLLPDPPVQSLSTALVPAYVTSELIPPHVKMDTRVCPHCHVTAPTQRCVECESVFCDACCANHHLRYGSMFNHTMALLSVPFCHSCEASSASQTCVDCHVNLCDACASFLHRKPPKHLHKRVPVYLTTTTPERLIKPKESISPTATTQQHTTSLDPPIMSIPQHAILYQPPVTTLAVAPHLPRCATCGGWGVDLIPPTRTYEMLYY